MNHDIGDRVPSTEVVAPGTETRIVPAVSTGEGPVVEPSAADSPHLNGDEPEGYDVADENTLQKESTRDDTGVKTNTFTAATSDHGGSTEVHTT